MQKPILLEAVCNFFFDNGDYQAAVASLPLSQIQITRKLTIIWGQHSITLVNIKWQLITLIRLLPYANAYEARGVAKKAFAKSDFAMADYLGEMKPTKVDDI